jgi:hypothetical protein
MVKKVGAFIALLSLVGAAFAAAPGTALERRVRVSWESHHLDTHKQGGN